ncbi:MAG TPA: hypothetical protein VGH99_12595 [Pseudonocardia sp.]|jgi:hypothetical protein
MTGTIPGRRGTRGLVAVLVMATLVLVAGCGPSSKSSAAPPSAPASASGAGCQQVGSVNFDKTKFVLHAGLAFGAFHHFIYKPFRGGTLHGFGPLAKAGLAGLFTVHELKVAKKDAESSPTLCKLVAPFDQASAAISSQLGKIKNGKATDQDMEGLDGLVGKVQNGSKADGVEVPDQVPSDGQLASGGVG